MSTTVGDNISAFKKESVTISASGTTSNGLDLDKFGFSIVGIYMPAAFTGTSISFLTSNDGSTYSDLYNASNTLISMGVTQGRVYQLSPGDLTALRYIKIKSSATEGSDRIITLIARLMG